MTNLNSRTVSTATRTIDTSSETLSPAATRVWLAVSANGTYGFPYGAGKLAYVTNLTPGPLRKAIDELLLRRLVQTTAGGGRKAYEPTPDAQPKLSGEVSEAQRREIVDLAKVDYFDFPATAKFGPVWYVETADIYDRSEDWEISQDPEAWREPSPLARVMAESDAVCFLDYLLRGEDSLVAPPADGPRQRATTDWSPTTGEHAHDPHFIDPGEVTDVALAGLWAWYVGYHHCLYAQTPRIPDIRGLAYTLARLADDREVMQVIDMLSYAAFNWGSLTRLPQLKQLALPRLPFVDCWENDLFAQTVFDLYMNQLPEF